MFKNTSSLFGVMALAMMASGAVYAVEVGDAAPCTVLQDIQPNGTEVQQCVSAKEGATSYAIVEFFSITCQPCLDNMPNLSELATALQDRATTRLVAIDRNEPAVRSYLSDQSKALIHFPVSLDSSRNALKAYSVNATPTLFVINSQNQVVYKHIGTMDSGDMDDIKQIVSR